VTDETDRDATGDPKDAIEEVYFGLHESRLIQCVMSEYIYSRNIRGPDKGGCH
jgi:hypothetical protein